MPCVLDGNHVSQEALWHMKLRPAFPGILITLRTQFASVSDEPLSLKVTTDLLVTQ